MPRALPATLLHQLERLPPANRYLIAFSGGGDSMALLQGMVEIQSDTSPQLLAVHIDHGLQAESRQWLAWCEERCAGLGVAFSGRQLNLRPVRGESPEATARHARYAALAELMQPGDILLTAHHRDDQAETLLLHLLRGSGLAGLSAMPVSRPFGPGLLARPLLVLSREQILDYLRERGSDWIDDPSNAELDFDRNFLRNRVMPLLGQRWPSAATTLSRSAGHCAEANDLLQQQAEAGLTALCPQPDQLDLDKFSRYSLAQRHWLMRAWLRRQQAPVPNVRQLERLCVEMLEAKGDRNPRVAWGGVEVRRYRERLYLITGSMPAPAQETIWWERPDDLQLPANGLLRVVPARGGLPPELWDRYRVQVRYRSGGEYCPARHKSLKKLLQELAIPPWQRGRIPLIFAGDRLIAIAGQCLCLDALEPDSEGLSIYWES